jgi:hypothetical protein
MSSKKPSQLSAPSTESVIIKWLPLIAAGGALGVSLYMLREIQKIKKETIKINSTGGMTKNQVKQVEAMDDQLRKISGFLSRQFPSPNESNKVAKDTVEDEEEEEEVEVEEVEVETTDDEVEENEEDK